MPSKTETEIKKEIRKDCIESILESEYIQNLIKHQQTQRSRKITEEKNMNDVKINTDIEQKIDEYQHMIRKECRSIQRYYDRILTRSLYFECLPTNFKLPKTPLLKKKVFDYRHKN